MPNNIKKQYSFNPLKHGFEPITNYPELGFNFPMIEGYYVKIVCYSNYGDLVYWYKTISEHVGLKPDDRIVIKYGIYDFRIETQTTPHTEYLGLVSNDEFAESLLKHLLGTTKNESLADVSVERYNQNIGELMRSEFPQHYKL